LNIEVLTDLEPVNAVGDLAIRPRLLDSRTKIGVPQRNAMLVAASGIDNLSGMHSTVSVDPVAPPPTVGGGRVAISSQSQRGFVGENFPIAN
jgi:hypothetical protein